MQAKVEKDYSRRNAETKDNKDICWRQQEIKLET